MANPLYQKHIISINDLSRDDLNLVLATAAKPESKPATRAVEAQSHCQLFLRSLYPYPPLFETSMHRLGASVVGFSDSANTSLGKKGETLADTISVISTYVDAIVMRHPQEGAARLATEFSGNVPVLMPVMAPTNIRRKPCWTYSLFRKPKGVCRISTSQWLVT
ncbi:hypothetical protein ACVXG9_02325 [Escherichia coli]